MTKTLTEARTERLLESIRAYEGVAALPTTAALAAGAGVTHFCAYDLLSRLQRHDEVWSSLQLVDGKPQRVWRIKHAGWRCAA